MLRSYNHGLKTVVKAFLRWPLAPNISDNHGLKAVVKAIIE
jgi:hypothetical protein